jgi:protein CpxP
MKTKPALIFSFLGLTLLAGLILRAADPTPAAPATPAAFSAAVATPDRKDEFRARMARRLGLTADQQTKLDDLRQKQHAAMDAVLQDGNLTADAKRAKMKEVAASYREQRLAVLTPEQKEKIARVREHFRKGGPRFAHFRGAGQRGLGPVMPGSPDFGPLAGELGLRECMKDRIAEKLGLTDEQRDKIEHIGRDTRAKQRDLLKSYHDQVRGVLTPEQLKQVDEWKELHRRGHPPFRAMFDGPAREGDDMALPTPADDMPPPPPGEPDAL